MDKCDQCKYKRYFFASLELATEAISQITVAEAAKPVSKTHGHDRVDYRLLNRIRPARAED